MKREKGGAVISIREQLQSERDKEKQLLITLMKSESKLRSAKRELKKNKKERDRAKRHYQSIVQNRMWKMAMPLYKLMKLGKRMRSIPTRHKDLIEENHRLSEENIRLRQELEASRNELSELRHRVKMLMIKPHKADEEFLRKTMRRSRDAGAIIDDLNRLINERKAYDHNYQEALKYAARLYTHERPELRNLVYNKVLSGLKSEEIPEVIVRSAETDHAIPLTQASSFRANLSMRARMRKLHSHKTPESVLDHKQMAYRFVDELGVKRPWTGKGKLHYTEITEKEGIVIKPVHGAGSRGVYLVLDQGRIQDVKRSMMLDNWDALITHMKKDLETGWVDADEWMTEELVYEDKQRKLPARDIKFYSFYGKIGLVLEIKRFPEVKYCWWTPQGERIQTGKYEEASFAGQGVSDEEIALAASISAEIPAPFMRIDFLKSHEGLVFGEFTPKPGNYDEFNDATDRMLGDCYLDAVGRLMADLLDGKQFNHFNKMIKQLNTSSTTDGNIRM